VWGSPQLGSTGYVTDRTGQILQHEEYLPSGEAWFEELKNGSATNRVPWQFNAKELDETGLYYYGARYYNPRNGVWMSPDPAFDGAFGTPMSLARYTYGHNNPVRFTDPTGLSAKTGTWTAEDPPTPGSYVDGGELVRGDTHIRGPGTANAHATPKVSKFDDLTPIQQPAPNWRDDGNPGHQALAQLTGDAPEMRGPQLRRQAYTDVAKTSAVVAANIAITAIPYVGEERALAATGEGANIVYRGLAAGENAAAGLVARAPGVTTDIASHVAGARTSQWISTTRSLAIATERFGKNGVVAIDLSKVGNPVVDLTAGIPGMPSNYMLSRWAAKMQEVLIMDSVPAAAIVPVP